MTTRKKIVIGLVSVLVVAGIVALILFLRARAPQEEPAASPPPAESSTPRSLGNERFGPRARPQSAANVDVGVLTVRSAAPTATPAPVGRRLAQAASPTATAQPQASPSGRPSEPRSSNPTVPPAPPPTPAPLPSFAPLPPAPAGQTRELAVVYAKGENQKRQIYLRSLDRDKDEQLVSSVFDDFAVAFSSAAQKVAFYSNEEGPSDAVKARTKLKVVDLATGKVHPLVSGLPGNWPAAWSGDGKKLAIPTATSIFIADVTTGTTLQVPTGADPGGIVWGPGDLKLYFQAEAGPDNHDIFEADAITAQTKPVATGTEDERLPAISFDSTKLSFLRAGTGQTGGAAVVVKSLGGTEEKAYPETAPADNYLFNLDFTQLVLVQGAKEPRLSRFKDGKVTSIGSLTGPVLVAWDRDYDHVFVLADDDQGKALFSVNIESAQTEKVKGGISGTVPGSLR